jgi:hypothetical protein
MVHCLSPSRTPLQTIKRKGNRKMLRLNERDLQLHVSILGWLFIAGNAVLLIIALVGFMLLPTLGAISGDPQGTAVLTVIGTAFGLLMVLLGLPGLVAGYGLLKRKPWARFLALVLGVLNLVNFPLGTLMGLYTAVVLFQESATHYFAPHQPA